MVTDARNIERTTSAEDELVFSLSNSNSTLPEAHPNYSMTLDVQKLVPTVV